MLSAVLTLGIAGLVFEASGFGRPEFKVEEDPRVAEILAALPEPTAGRAVSGCAGLAEAVARGEAPCNACIPGRRSCRSGFYHGYGLRSG